MYQEDVAVQRRRYEAIKTAAALWAAASETCHRPSAYTDAPACSHRGAYVRMTLPNGVKSANNICLTLTLTDFADFLAVGHRCSQSCSCLLFTTKKRTHVVDVSPDGNRGADEIRAHCGAFSFRYLSHLATAPCFRNLKNQAKMVKGNRKFGES